MGLNGEDGIRDRFDHVGDCAGRVFDVGVVVFGEFAVGDLQGEG